jgi:2',3'-cyclic-nucleotide 2'-phosphodiesterase (5'-nucleotidase family)
MIQVQEKHLFIALLLIGFTFSPISEAATRLTLLHTSEHHGSTLPDEDGMGGLAYIAAVVNQIRAQEKNVLLLNSGDLLIGTSMSTVFRGIPDILAMNLMKFDAVAVGNHEFDFGLTAFQNLRDLARFPFLSANVMLNLTNRTTPIQPWMIQELDGLKVAILGLTTTEAREIIDPSVAKQITVLDSVPVVRQAIRTFSGQADLIIALTHQDNVDDLTLAKEVPEIDVIVGGHTEGFDGIMTTYQSTPVKELKNPSTVYVKTHRLGKTLGRLDLTIEDGNILNAQAENISIDSRKIAPDAEVAHLLKTYSDQMTDKLDKIVGKTSVNLSGDRNVIRSQESNLGNFIADAIRNYAQTDVAFVNAGSIRASIKAGEIKVGDLYRVFPFLGNTVVKFKITGTEIQEALENSVSQIEKGAGRFLQVSGLTYAYNPKAPIGQRILEVKINGSSLIPNQIYTASTTNYLAEGGDGYIVFRENKKEYLNTLKLFIDVLLEYIQKQRMISPRVEGRIIEKS